MIVRLDQRLFEEDHANDALLLEILNYGKDRRYGVLVEPAFRSPPAPYLKAWLDRQSDSSRRTANLGLRLGTEWKRYRLPDGRKEPEVIIEPRNEPEWPTSFDDGPARLPLDHTAQVFLNTGLGILVENGRADWRFLKKVVPTRWATRWKRAIERNWIVRRNGSGISEMRQQIVQDISHNQNERLRTWALFDSDAEGPNHISEEATTTREACIEHRIPFHLLQRRMIENYIPQAVMERWAAQIQQRVHQQSKRRRYRDEADRAVSEVDKYWALTPPERHHYKLKAIGGGGGAARRAMGFGEPADIWRDEAWQVTQADITNDGWKAEQDAMFLSLFASL